MSVRGWTWLALLVGLVGFWAAIAVALITVVPAIQGIGERIAAVIP